MNFHSRFVGALDALILGLAGLLMVALLFALLNPLAATDRLAALPDQAGLHVDDHLGGGPTVRL